MTSNLKQSRSFEDINISSVQHKYISFLTNATNIGHVNRAGEFPELQCYVQEGLDSSISTVGRIQRDLPRLKPKVILEVGCSVGLNCFALQDAYPDATVIGIEPESTAVELALTLSPVIGTRVNQPMFIHGVGELLPLENESVDLVICHTVIEHVKDVSRVIAEISRVLRVGGVLHLDAPNYVWPYEPHLNVWCLPLMGKRSVRMFAILQRGMRDVSFLNHLQFITPYMLEREFKKNGLMWTNRVQEKMLSVVNGDMQSIHRYKFLAKIVSLTAYFGVSRFLISLVVRLGIYPSVMYNATKASIANKPL
jgi:SAM-dependent methyltransferase